MNFNIITGIELGCFYDQEEVHILGYFIDYNNTELLNELDKLKTSRWKRGIEIIKKLNDLGIKLNMDSILSEAEASGFIGRALIARKLVSEGYVNSIKEAFDKYLDVGKPAYVKRYQLSIKDTIDLIHSVDGISVLAHPGLLSNKDIMTFCVKQGIMGIECYHTKHTKEDEKYFIKFAIENNLIITGGSDFHGDEDILGSRFINLEECAIFKELIQNVERWTTKAISNNYKYNFIC